MSSIIASIISSTLGFVLNKARNTAADKLKQRGDVTDEQLRNVIVEELNDIKTKIDGLARKDLLASYSFLKEGVMTLNVALDEAKDEEQISKDEGNTDQDGGSKTTETTKRNQSKSGVLNEAIELSTAIQKLNNTSNGRLVAAKDCFKDARVKATEAFCNEALSLPDRIMATKLRVVSKILECLQETKVAVAGCMLFLEELHNLPAIEETFSTYFKGGLKSIFYQGWRLENVKSVLSLNFAVSEFIARFSGELPNVRNWPRIHLLIRGETIHPLVIHADVVKEIFDNEEFQPPENHVILNEIHRDYCAINSKGEVFVVNDNVINIINRSGDRKTFCKLRQATANVKGSWQVVKGLAIDSYDNVFVVIKFDDWTSNTNMYVLFVFDSSAVRKHERLLDLFNLTESSGTIMCRVNHDSEFLVCVIRRDDHYIMVCDSTGTLKYRLTLDENSSYNFGDYLSLQCVTEQNELVMRKHENVLVFTRDGQLKRTIKSGCVTCSYHENVSYNHQTSKIEVLVPKERSKGTTTSFSILNYSENSEVERLYVPVKDWLIFPKIIYHPAGPGAICIYQGARPHDCSIVFM